MPWPEAVPVAFPDAESVALSDAEPSTTVRVSFSDAEPSTTILGAGIASFFFQRALRQPGPIERRQEVGMTMKHLEPGQRPFFLQLLLCLATPKMMQLPGVQRRHTD